MEINNLKTPCYVVELKKFQENLNDILFNFTKEWGKNVILGYSFKTNNLSFLLKEAKNRGMYAEVVSKEEYNEALKLGYLPRNIILNGPQKKNILTYACNNGSYINIDSLEELDDILSKYKNNKQLKLGLRINFDLETKCPNETNTGKEISRFGICIENGDFKKAIEKLKEYNIPLKGLHCHTTSKTRSTNVYFHICQEVNNLITQYNLKELHYIDIGGGFFGGLNLVGKPTMKEYAKTICGILKLNLNPLKTTLILEPGSCLLASCIDYYTKVLSIKDIRGEKIITLDGSVLDINPFLLNRVPMFSLLGERKETKVYKQIVCGSTCLEKDRFMTLMDQKEITLKTLFKFENTGAYTISFNNSFINVPPRVYAKDDSNIFLVREVDK